MILISYMLSFDWGWPLLHVLLFSCVMPCVIFDDASRKRAETDVGMRWPPPSPPPPHSEGVNVKRCFYLMIIHLKDWLTCQTAEGGLISSLMFRPPAWNSSSLSSSPSNFFFFDLSGTADFVLVQFCPSLFSSVSTCPGLHSQNSKSVKVSSHCRWKTFLCVFCKEHSTTTSTTNTFTFQDRFVRVQT